MCSKCGKKSTEKCGCEKTIICGCKNKFDLLCTYYDGVELKTIEIKKGMSGNEILAQIDKKISEITPEEPEPATLTTFGVVAQSVDVENITTQNATDLASALVLINELKAKLNAKLNADRDSGQQYTN